MGPLVRKVQRFGSQTVCGRKAQNQVVVTKEFIEKIKEKPDRGCEAPEIDWRGRLYVGFHQLMGNAERDEPKPGPVCVG